MLRLSRLRNPLLRSSNSVKRRWASSKPPEEDEEYSRKTPREHVLLRPGMYVGQVEPSASETWVLSTDARRMERKSVTYSKALIKLFDEIIVNAADNRQRDKSMSAIDVSISVADPERPEITISNDGRGIPVKVHSSEGIYIPELIFGHLMTGSNFDDTKGRVTGGRHGYGAKLANILSHYFEVETYDSQRHILYRQRWEENMSVKHEPAVEYIEDESKRASMKDYTRVTFAPDLARFKTASPAASASGYARTSEAAWADAVGLMRRRAFDVAACISPVKVSFDGTTVPVDSFEEYVRLFRLTDDDDDASAFEDPRKLCMVAKPSARWQVAVQRSHSGSFENMAFVNNLWTSRGGSHVTAVTSQITKVVEELMEKKGVKVSPGVVRSKLMVFVNALIENPNFDSQSKDTLTTRPADFGSTPALQKGFIKDVVTRLGIVEDLMVDAGRRERAQLLRAASRGAKGSRGLDIPKLEDAHWAGSERGPECSLILTEGDSAKALAVSGLEVAGRERYGVLPLRGKILNVSEVTPRQLLQNAELVSLCRTLGLDFNKSYEHDLSGLRYGRVLLMCDQDLDGSHIKGLVINFFHKYWPHLLKNHDFIGQFCTPLMKVSGIRALDSEEVLDGGKDKGEDTGKGRGKGKGKGKSLSFYSMAEFEEWRAKRALAATDRDGDTSADSFKIKYYKGLGTSTSAEGKEYFAQLDRHSMGFTPATRTDDAIDLAFNKSRSEDRKAWIVDKYDPKSFVDPRHDRISYEDFIDTELVQFSHWDNVRSIPSVVDGLKPSQRKVLYSCFKRKLKEDIKVVQLGGYVAEQTAYHHGDRALYGTIVNMAQDFVGANNVPLLEASGQFGTRAVGGKDFASPRYIFTRLTRAARLLFPEVDDELLESQEEDGLVVEPKVYVPVIPTLLLNGCSGIGTGWSSFVPSHRPTLLVDHVAGLVRGGGPQMAADVERDLGPLRPWMAGFQGPVLGEAPSYTLQGICQRLSKTTVEITELPAGRWTADYKEHLFRMIERGLIKNFTEHHTSDHVRFLVVGKEKALDKMSASKGGLHRAFVLDRPMTLTNMHAFDRAGRIRRYESPREVMEEHFEARLELYHTRRTLLMQKATYDEALCRNRAHFIGKLQAGELDIAGQGSKSREDVTAALRDAGLESHEELQALAGSYNHTSGDVTASGAKSGKGFDYLLDMPFQSLTAERAADLLDRSQRARVVLEDITHATAEDLWMRDLDALRPTMEKVEGRIKPPAMRKKGKAK